PRAGLLHKAGLPARTGVPPVLAGRPAGRRSHRMITGPTGRSPRRLSVAEDHVEDQAVVRQALLVGDGELDRPAGPDVVAEAVAEAGGQAHEVAALAGQRPEVRQV